jgi:hypothetical protein
MCREQCRSRDTSTSGMPYRKFLSLFSAVTVWAGIVVAVAAPKYLADLLAKAGASVTQTQLFLAQFWHAVPLYACHGLLLYAAGVSSEG